MTGRNPKDSRSGARWAAGAISVGLHLGVPLLLLMVPSSPTKRPELPSEPILVELFTPPPLSPSPDPAPDEAAPEEAGAASGPVTQDPPTAPPPLRLREAPPTRQIPPVPVAPSPAPQAPVVMASLGAAELSGAARAGSGSGRSGDGSGAGDGAGRGSGGACDMIRRLQNALRDDEDLRVAVAQAHGDLSSSSRALLIWNGDWIQNPGQEGKGLAGLRQAIAAEVAFSPRECRTQSVRGLVLLTLADAPGAPRVVLGTDSWRWSDLTGAR